MKRLLKVKPGGRGVGTVLPEQNGFYYPLFATYHPAIEEFFGTAVDTDDWSTTNATLGTGGATITVASSIISLNSGTATAGLANLKLQSAGYAGSTPAHIYNLPLRVRFNARMNNTAGSGVSPTAGSLDVYMGIRNIADNLSQNAVAAETFIAQFHLDLTTAGGSSCATPVVETQVYSGSTAAAFLSSSAFNPFTTAASNVHTATAFHGYVIEATQRGVWFSMLDDVSGQEPGRLLNHVAVPLLRQDLNYYIDARLVANGTAAFTMTASITLDIDQIVISQITNQDVTTDISDQDKRVGGIRCWTNTSTTYAPSLAAALVTAGAGILYAVNVASTATGAVNLYVSAYDATIGNSGLYAYSVGASMSANSRLLFAAQVMVGGSTPALLNPNAITIPNCGIPFFRGLVIGDTNSLGTAVGGSAVQCSVVYRTL